jgi:ribonuclease HII
MSPPSTDMTNAELRRRLGRDGARKRRLEELLRLERSLWSSGVVRVAGVDEAGVGPLAGPVVAAAVVFPPGTGIEGVDDSKTLDPRRRDELAAAIRDKAADVGLGRAEVEEIDALNVYQASLLAMRRAVESLRERPGHVLVDARVIPGLAGPQTAITHGDRLHFSIAAASIIAKTVRDGLMEEVDRRFPQYGFARHKGYATPGHQDAIRRFGPCAIHRTSYAFIHELCGGFSQCFYELRRDLEEARTPLDLARVEDELDRLGPALATHERRKLRLVLGRRQAAQLAPPPARFR